MFDMDETLERELILSKTHESIISRRERLVRQAESQLEDQEQFQFTLVNRWHQAKKRNKALLEDIKHFQAVFKERIERPYSADFITLKEQYWSMVEKELPGWKVDVKNSKQEVFSPR